MYPGLSTVPCALLLFTVDLRDLGFSWTFLSRYFSLFFWFFFLYILLFFGGDFHLSPRSSDPYSLSEM